MVHSNLVCFYCILFACYDKPPSSFAVLLVYSLNSSSVFKVSFALSLPPALPYNQLLLLFNFPSCTSVMQFSCAITLFMYAVMLFIYAVTLFGCAVAVQTRVVAAGRARLGTKANSISRWLRVCFPPHSLLSMELMETERKIKQRHCWIFKSL